MTEKDRHYKNTFIAPEQGVVEALRIIDNASLQIALVVDASHKLLGTVTDGDIRRAILANASLASPVSEVMNKNPITVADDMRIDAVLDLMNSRKIYQVPIIDAQRRVVGLHWMHHLLLQQEQQEKQRTIAPASYGEVRVVLMLGGEGKRLHPLTQDTPKPMLPIGGKPLLETIVSTFVSQGFRKFYFSVNYKSAVIQQHFGDGSAFGAHITYINEETPLGTAGSLSLLPKKPAGSLIVMNGDLLTNVNFSHLVDFHRQTRAQATMCVREYNVEVPYGIVESNGVSFGAITEKPSQSSFVNAGIYVINPDVLDYIPQNSYFDMPQLFSKIRDEGGESTVFPIHEYWLDIGRFEDLERARSEYAQVFSS